MQRVGLLGIFEMQQQPWSPSWLWAALRRALYTLLLLLSEARQALITASPSAKAPKTRMEIREQDFSFSDGARERPVIEVVTKDVRTADIFNIMEAIRGDEEVAEEGASWWKYAVTDEFSRQDVLVLALIALCVLRLLIFVVQVTWRLVRLPMQWYDALEKEEDEEVENEGNDSSEEASSSLMKKQLAIIRFCHLQFLLVVEKLKREMREDKSEDTQQLVASLAVSQHKDGKDVTLSEILATLQKIQAKDSSFQASEVEEHLADIKHDVEDEEDIDDGLPEAWTRLQEIYASFLRIQATIIRRQKRRKTWQWQMQQHDQQQQAEEGPRRRLRRLPSSEDPTAEVLLELQELTKELPQGFTSDMFTSLGNAMHEKMVAVEPETSPAPSPQLETRPPRSSTMHTSVIRAEAK